jgi:hypothetical protein
MHCAHAFSTDIVQFLRLLGDENSSLHDVVERYGFVMGVGGESSQFSVVFLCFAGGESVDV